MTTMTLGFVPLINIFETFMEPTYLLLYWAPFGISCIILGFFIDKVKNKENLCFSFVIWGFLIIGLIYVIPNVLLTLIFVVLAAIITAVNTIIAASYISSNIQMNRRGFITSIYLGIGWVFVAGSAYLSFLNIYLNLAFLGSINIAVGLICYGIFQSGKAALTWEQQMIIPRDYNVKRNGQIFYFSTLVFGMFLGIIVFLLGTSGRLEEAMASFYLENIEYYYDAVASFGFGTHLANFDFLAIGALTALLSPIIGKMIDKIGRKTIFFLGNMIIPTVLILFAFWTNLILLAFSVFLYAAVVTIFVVINCNVWSDLSPAGKIARFNGYGWSSLGLGGASGFLIGYLITSPSVIENIDVLVIITIILVSELSLIPFVLMKESLPPSEELEWSKEIIQLFVISISGIVMTSYSFEEQSTLENPDLFSGGISGVTMILKEMTDSQEKLKIIDHEDKKLLFEYGENFFTTLVTRKALKILRTKLADLTAEIEGVFWETIASWNGNLEVFTPLKTMIRNYFVQ